MKKKLFAVVIAVAIALAVVPLALAAGNHGGSPAKPHAKGKPFYAKGKVVSVDLATGTLVVTVANGSNTMKPYFGMDETFTLAAGSRIFARTVGPHGKVHFKNATLDKVTPGSRANINGRFSVTAGPAPVFFAQHIVVRIAAPTPTPTPTDTSTATPAPAL